MNKKITGMMRRYLFSGLAAIVPLFATFYLLFLVFRISNRFAGEYINDILMDNYGFSVPGLGVAFLFLAIILTGVLVNNFLGRKIFGFFDRLFNKAPIISGIYPAAKRLSDFLFREEHGERFKKVVLAEYPSSGSYSIGFLTNEGVEEFNRKTGKELVMVLVPLSPMPYSGMLLALPREKLVESDMTVNEAVRLVLSGGVVAPGEKF